MFRVEDADACRAIDLMGGAGEEIAVEPLHVYVEVDGRLGTVDQHQRPHPMCGADDVFDGLHDTQRIGDMDDGHDARAGREQFQERFILEGTVLIHRHYADAGAPFFGHHLPGDDV